MDWINLLQLAGIGVGGFVMGRALYRWAARKGPAGVESMVGGAAILSVAVRAPLWFSAVLFLAAAFLYPRYHARNQSS